MTEIKGKKQNISVVMPCYGGRANVLEVLENIPEIVSSIYCIDDACPEKTGELIKSQCNDNRVRVITHEKNLGVGGAMVTGYRAALSDNADIIVKLDCDGQMDPGIIPRFIKPIATGHADYTKGNRFFRHENLKTMPGLRLLGNSVLSFMSKFSTGYWRIFDPNNGYTAIHADVLRLVPLEKLSRDYFFESDMLFRLNTIRAVVIDVPMEARYENESSNLSILSNIFIFSFKHTRNFVKRLIYNYFLRDFSVASIEWLLGPFLLLFGVVFGVYKWVEHANSETVATSGTVMLAALTTLIGIQFLLSAMHYDIENTPTVPLIRLLDSRDLQ